MMKQIQKVAIRDRLEDCSWLTQSPQVTFAGKERLFYLYEHFCLIR